MSSLQLVVGSALCIGTLCLGCGAQSPRESRGGPLPVAPATAGSAPPASRTTSDWHLTVYYTPVESYHGAPRKPISDCVGRTLGEHSVEFLEHVQTEGFGRFLAPVQEHGYLGWDFARHCWFTAATPVGANDRPLRAWVSTAAPSTFAAGTRLRVVSCGTAVEAAVCARVEAAAWTVDDRCSDGCSDPRHLDLYVGEEDTADFEDKSPDYFDAHGAVVALRG